MFTQRKRHLVGLVSAGAFAGWAFSRNLGWVMPIAVICGALIGFMVWRHDRDAWQD